MKDYQAAEIRNFAIVGHASSGKTMLSESMLATAGVINRMGSISAGSTVSDYHDSEQQRQISVSATLMHLEWLGKKFNIIDCPGYADFISEGLGALRVGDFALVVVHGRHRLVPADLSAPAVAVADHGDGGAVRGSQDRQRFPALGAGHPAVDGVLGRRTEVNRLAVAEMDGQAAAGRAESAHGPGRGVRRFGRGDLAQPEPARLALEFA
jgi:hypothetical protein